MQDVNKYELYPLGDSALVVQLGPGIDVETHRRVQIFVKALEERPFAGMIELVPAFASVTVFYDPVRVLQGDLFRSDAVAEGTPYERVCASVEPLLGEWTREVEYQPQVVEIPVCYGGDFGPDLGLVAEHNGLTPDEVVEIHASGEYLVYMIGFAPGFPYLGGMSERIAAPRRSSPRMAIPAGTVGIAGEQTGVYPIETPGGWQLIGRTPLKLFRPDAKTPSLLAAGNLVRFKPISRDEYDRWEEGAR